jgi:hypothetical protein
LSSEVDLFGKKKAKVSLTTLKRLESRGECYKTFLAVIYEFS